MMLMTLPLALPAQVAKVCLPYGAGTSCVVRAPSFVLAMTDDQVVYVKHDTAGRWAKVNVPYSNLTLRSPVVYANTVVFVNAYEGLFIYDIDQNSMEKLWSPEESQFYVSDVFSRGDTLLVGVGKDVYMSPSVGMPFFRIKTQPELDSYHNYVGFNDSYIFKFLPSDGILIRTTKQGGEWDTLTLPLGVDAPYYLKVIDEDLVLLSFGAVWISTDNGMSWQGKFFVDANEFLVEYIRVHGKEFAGTITGLFTYDATIEKWVRVDSEIGNTSVKQLSHDSREILAATEWGVFVSRDEGETWKGHNLGICSEEVYLYRWCDKLLAQSNPGNFVRSTDGSSWNEESLGKGKVTSSGVSDSTVLITAGKVAYRSTDCGATFTMIDTGSTTGIKSSKAGIEGNNAYVTADSIVLLSSNAGASWTQVPTQDEVWFKAGVAFACGAAFIAGDNGVLRASMAGGTYEKRNNGINIVPVARVNSIVSHHSALVCSNRQGVYMSHDCGESWSTASNGLNQDDPVNSLISKGDVLFGGTFEGQLFRWSESGQRWTLECDLKTFTREYSLEFDKEGMYIGTDRGLWLLPVMSHVANKQVHLTHGDRSVRASSTHGQISITCPHAAAGAWQVSLYTIDGQLLALKHGSWQSSDSPEVVHFNATLLTTGPILGILRTADNRVESFLFMHH